MKININKEAILENSKYFSPSNNSSSFFEKLSKGIKKTFSSNEKPKIHHNEHNFWNSGKNEIFNSANEG